MFQRLYPRHFIRGNNVYTFPFLLLGALVQAADLIYFVRKRFRGLRLFRGMKPITDLVGMQVYLILKKRLTDFAEICSAIPCLLISDTNSGRFHWLTSYPKSFGLLQTRLMTRMIWSGVKTDGAPGRFLSDRIARISSSSFSGSSFSIFRRAGSATRNRPRQVATLLK